MDLFSHLLTHFVRNLFISVSTKLFEGAKGHFQNLTQLVFYLEERVGDITGLSLHQIERALFIFGIALIVVKFLYRGFCIYVVGVDGDITASPEALLLNFVKALALASAFPLLYEVLVDVTMGLIQDLGLFIQADWSNLFNGITDLWAAAVALIWLICYFIFRLMMVKAGLEMLILRFGFPLACTGIMDSDGGVFTTYSKKFFQVAASVVVQITLVQLSLSFAVGGDPIISIAALITAIKTPNFLREFMLASGGNGIGLSSKIHAISSLKRLVTRR